MQRSDRPLSDGPDRDADRESVVDGPLEGASSGLVVPAEAGNHAVGVDRSDVRPGEGRIELRWGRAGGHRRIGQPEQRQGGRAGDAIDLEPGGALELDDGGEGGRREERPLPSVLRRMGSRTISGPRVVVEVEREGGHRDVGDQAGVVADLGQLQGGFVAVRRAVEGDRAAVDVGVEVGVAASVIVSATPRLSTVRGSA